MTTTFDTSVPVSVTVTARKPASAVRPVYVVNLAVEHSTVGAWSMTAPSVAETIFGLVYPASDGANHRAAFPHNKIIRVYNSPGKGIAGWSSAGLKAALPGQTVRMSYKDSPVTPAVRAQLIAFLDGIPVTTPEVRVIFRHEEHSPDIAGYKAGSVVQRQIIDDHRNGAKVRTEECYMRFQIDSGQDVDAYHPEMPDGKPAADYLAIDSYSPQQRDYFMGAPALFADAVMLGARYGMPVTIPEVGLSLKAGTHRDSIDRVTSIEDIAAEARRVGLIDVSWFSSNEGDYPYRLLDDPDSQAAWLALQPA